MVEIIRSVTPNNIHTASIDLKGPTRTMFASLSARNSFRDVKIPSAIATSDSPLVRVTALSSARAVSSPLPDSNALLDVKIPEAVLTPDSRHLQVPSSATSDRSPNFDSEIRESFVAPDSSTTVDSNPLLDVPVPESVLTPDRENFELPLRSPYRRTFSPKADRCSHSDVELPEASGSSVVQELEIQSFMAQDSNPLLDIPVPETILTPERENFGIPLPSPYRRTFLPVTDRSTCLDVEMPEAPDTQDVQHVEIHLAEDSNPLLDIPVPETILTPERQTFEHPLTSPSRRAFFPAADRNPLHDVEIPNEIVAPDFPHPKPSPLPTAYSARPLSSLSCPPSLLANEWTLFITELEHAAGLSKRQKTIAVAVGIFEPIGSPTTNGVLTWGMWRYLAIKNVKSGLRNEAAVDQRRKRESITAVGEKWNEKWADKGVKVALEVRNKRDNRLRSRKSHHSRVRMMSEDAKPEAIESEGASELEEDLRDFQMIQEVM